MAFSGLHVSCHKVAGLPERSRQLPVYGKPYWSAAPASTVVSSEAAPAPQDASVVFRVYSSADAYISVGGSPDASASPRTFVPAYEPVDILVDPGDRFAWLAA